MAENKRTETLIVAPLRRIIFFMILLFVVNLVYPQTFSDYSFLIADLPESAVSDESVINELRMDQTGMSVMLEYNSTVESLLLNDHYSFEQFSEVVSTYLKNHKERIFPLFIDYAGPVRVLNEAIVNSGLSDLAYYLPPGERWPDVSEILESRHNLIIFIFQKPNPGNPYFHYAWDYMAEYPHSGIEDPLFDGHYINGDITNELLLIRDFEIPVLAGSRTRFVLDLNQNQYYINHLLNRWKNTGKQPNFIFTKWNTRYLSPLIPWLSTYKSVKGVVKINDKPMEKVFWKHSNKCITNGYFSFPYSEGEELNLTPFSPGYRFDPQSSVVSAENLLLSISFNASPLPMQEGLTAFFPFDTGWKNFMNGKDKIEPVHASITSDVTMGEVAKLPDSSYIVIGSPEYYGIRNNSFTVSTWFKLNEVDLSDEYSILGTQEGVFRKGLHLVIRQGRPYFGFYGNDLWADKVVSPNKWYHIVYRYNYFNGEQAIYVDAQNVGASFNHASFIGDSALVIGQSINSNNFLNGYIDDLYIWNRPLGEDEIQFLYHTDYIPKIEEEPGYPIQKWLIPMVAFVLLLIIAFLFIMRLKNPGKKIKEKIGTEENSSFKNTVLLFGDLQVFDAGGNEISSQFTPKVTELFLLVLLFTIKSRKGIKTEKLTAILWPGFAAKKAANNRSVTFNKLRKTIEAVKGLSVSHHNGYWRADFENEFYCDYREIVAMLQNQQASSKQEMEHFFSLVKKGIFLNELEWEWLEEFRGFIVNEIIDNLILFASKLNENDDCKILKALAERILAIDKLNEKALQIVVRQLTNSNNLNQARYRFKQFADAFEQEVGQAYNLTFDEFRDARL